LQKYTSEVENLGGETEGSIDERLEFYMENINGMTQEVHDLRGV